MKHIALLDYIALIHSTDRRPRSMTKYLYSLRMKKKEFPGATKSKQLRSLPVLLSRNTFFSIRFKPIFSGFLIFLMPISRIDSRNLLCKLLKMIRNVKVAFSLVIQSPRTELNKKKSLFLTGFASCESVIQSESSIT